MSDNAMVWGAEANADERMWAMIAHVVVLLIPVPILGAMLVYLVKKDDSKYIAYHAMQAVIFQLVMAIISSMTCGVGLIGFVFSIILALKANKGLWEGYPLLEGVGREG